MAVRSSDGLASGRSTRLHPHEDGIDVVPGPSDTGKASVSQLLMDASLVGRQSAGAAAATPARGTLAVAPT